MYTKFRAVENQRFTPIQFRIEKFIGLSLNQFVGHRMTLVLFRFASRLWINCFGAILSRKSKVVATHYKLSTTFISIALCSFTSCFSLNVPRRAHWPVSVNLERERKREIGNAHPGLNAELSKLYCSPKKKKVRAKEVMTRWNGTQIKNGSPR